MESITSTTDGVRRFIISLVFSSLLLGLSFPAYSQVANYSGDLERFSFRDGWNSNTFDYEMQVQRDKYISLAITFDVLSFVGFMSGMFLYDSYAVEDISNPKAWDFLLSFLSGAALATPFIFGDYYFRMKAKKIIIEPAVGQILPQSSQTPTYALSVSMQYRF